MSDQAPENSQSTDPQSAPATTSMPRRRRRWRYVALTFFLLFVAGEVAARLFADRNSRFNISIGAAGDWDPHRRVRWKKNYVGPGFSINSKGFVGAEFDDRKTPGSYRIVCLGDSCTMVPAGYTYPDALQKELREAISNRPIDVINAGCPGYESIQVRIWYEEDIDAIEHDMLLIYVGWNDMGQYNPDGLAHKLDQSGYLTNPTLTQRIMLHCYLLRSVYLIVDRIERRGDVDMVPLVGEEAKKYDEFYPIHFENNLTEIIKLAKSRGRKVFLCDFAGIVSTDPTPDEKARIHFPRGMGKSLPKYVALFNSYRTALRKVAETTGVPLINLAGGFPDAESRKCFTDSCHFNREGSDRVAGEIVPVVKPAILEFFASLSH